MASYFVLGLHSRNIDSIARLSAHGTRAGLSRHDVKVVTDITGLPFTSNTVGDNYGGAMSPQYAGFAAGLTTPPMFSGIPNTATLQMTKTGAGTSSNLVDTDLTNTSSFHFQLTYRI